MRILQINILATEKSTGRTTIELNDYLKKIGHESFVAYARGPKLDDNHFLKITSALDYYSHNLLSRFFGTQGHYSKYGTNKLIKWIKRIKPDVVHLRNLHSNFINLEDLFSFLNKNNIPIVITTHDFWFFTAYCPYPKENCNIQKCDECLFYNKKPTLFYNPKREINMKMKLFSSNNIFIQANSYFSKTIVERSLFNKFPIEVIYNWIDFKYFYPDDKANVFDFIDKPVVLVVWSLLDENQFRFKMFVEVAEALCDKYCFVMVGKCNFDNKKYPNVVFFNETNDKNTLRKYYSSASVFFNPSITDTFGKVVAESVSCCTPAVVFNTQALPEIIGDDECGIIVNEISSVKAINAIEEVISRGKKYYYNNCYNRSRKMFDIDNNCSKLVSFYERIINKRDNK